MLMKVAFQRLLGVLAFAFLVLNVVLKLLLLAAMQRTRDHDRDSSSWFAADEPGEVLLEIDSWTRYSLFSPLEWQPLFPAGGIVHLGPKREPYTVSMLHQLRCLDVIRDQLSRVKAERDEEPTRHCLNYLRQMLQCRGDLQLDAYQYAHKVGALHPHAVRRCKDWRVVYQKVAENHRLDSV